MSGALAGVRGRAARAAASAGPGARGRGPALGGMVLGACLIALVAGCVIGELAGEETAGETGEAPAEPGARVVGQVDVIELCGTNEAYAVSFRARKIGCEPGPPAPCTIRTDPYEEIVGDAATCPASHNSLEMAVVVGSAGRWQIEAVTLTSSGSIGPTRPSSLFA